MNVLGTPSGQEVQDMCDSVEVNLPMIKGIGLKKVLKNVEDNE